MELTNEIKEVIQNTLPDAVVYVVDPHNDNTHLEAWVISDAFKELSRIKQHQLVMLPLKDTFATSLHALALKTFTHQQWDEVKHNYLPQLEKPW